MCNQCPNFPHCLINIFRAGLSQDSNKIHTLYLVDMVLASCSNFLVSLFTFFMQDTCYQCVSCPTEILSS